MTYLKLLFAKLKKFVSRSVFGGSNSSRYHWILNFLLQLKNQQSGNKPVCGFSITFIMKRVMTFQSQRVSAFWWKKIYTLIKTKRNRKWKISHKVLERWNLGFSLYKNCRLKVKLWWVWSSRKKKSAFL